MWPISTGGAELAMPGMLWCSATQNRRYAEPFGVPGQVDRGAQGLAGGPAVRHRGEVEHGQGHGPRAEGQGRIVHDLSQPREAAHSSGPGS